MGRLRAQLRQAERKAQGDGIVLRLKDGTARAFETIDIQKAMFLTQMDLFRKTSVHSEVLDAVRNATPESRAAFEERFGSITMTSHVVASEPEGDGSRGTRCTKTAGWKRRFTKAARRRLSASGGRYARGCRIDGPEPGIPARPLAGGVA